MREPLALRAAVGKGATVQIATTVPLKSGT